MEELEELKRALAEVVIFLRGEAICPHHPHVTEVVLTPEGWTPWHGPSCEGALGTTFYCEYRELRKELVAKAVEALGTADMGQFL